jgi:hypothetical protein
MEPQWNDTGREKPNNLEKNCPNVTSFTTNPSQPNPGANQGIRSDRLTTNCMSHDMAKATN